MSGSPYRWRGAASCVFLAAVFAVAPVPRAAADDAPEGVPVLPPGTLTLHVTPTSAELRPVPGMPRTWEAGPFEVEATCPLRTWAVLLEVSPLAHQQDGYAIGPERIQFVPLPGDAAAPRDAPAARNFAGPVPVLEGGVGTRVGPSGRSSFILRVTMNWTDPAGTYVGALRFSHFAAP